MKTSDFSKVYESAKEVMNNTKDSRRAWRVKFNTLTRLLHDTQTRDAWKITEPIYEALGLPITRKVSRSDVESLVHIWHTDKKGNRFPAYVSRRIETDADGNEVKDADGNTKYYFVTSPVKDGSWSLDKLARVLACSNNYKEKK